MTEKQRKLVADNHNLIYSFLIEHGLDVEEFYDLAAIGLCKAAMKYDETRSNVFSTLAYRYMLIEVNHYFDYKNRQRRIPDNLIGHYNKKTYGDEGEIGEVLDCMSCSKQFEDELIFELCVKKVRERMSDRDKLIFDMLIDGYTTREIGKAAGCSNVNITNIRRKICGMFGDLI